MLIAPWLLSRCPALTVTLPLGRSERVCPPNPMPIAYSLLPLGSAPSVTTAPVRMLRLPLPSNPTWSSAGTLAKTVVEPIITLLGSAWVSVPVLIRQIELFSTVTEPKAPPRTPRMA